MPFPSGWTRLIAVTRSPAPPSADAMARAPGRCEVAPAAYRIARPTARPASTVMSRVSSGVRSTPTCTTEYTATATHSDLRQAGRPMRPTMVV